MNRWSRSIAALLVLAMVSSGCAYILHPERRGWRGGGTIDGGALLLDILLFIPGIIPGVVALAVDFSSGAIYTGGYSSGHYRYRYRSSREQVLPRGSRLAITRPVVKQPAWFELRLIAPDGRLLVKAGERLLPGQSRGPLLLSIPAGPAQQPTRAELQLVVDGKLQGRVPVRLL